MIHIAPTTATLSPLTLPIMIATLLLSAGCGSQPELANQAPAQQPQVGNLPPSATRDWLK